MQQHETLKGFLEDSLKRLRRKKALGQPSGFGKLLPITKNPAKKNN